MKRMNSTYAYLDFPTAKVTRAKVDAAVSLYRTTTDSEIFTSRLFNAQGEEVTRLVFKHGYLPISSATQFHRAVLGLVNSNKDYDSYPLGHQFPLNV